MKWRDEIAEAMGVANGDVTAFCDSLEQLDCTAENVTEFEEWAKENHCLTVSAWKAWNAAIEIEREACATTVEMLCDHEKEVIYGIALDRAARSIRMRSNVELTGAARHERKTKP